MLSPSLSVIGIEDGIFLGDHPGFDGTIKREPSDFIVSMLSCCYFFLSSPPDPTTAVPGSLLVLAVQSRPLMYRTFLYLCEYPNGLYIYVHSGMSFRGRGR